MQFYGHFWEAVIVLMLTKLQTVGRSGMVCQLNKQKQRIYLKKCIIALASSCSWEPLDSITKKIR